MPTTSYHSGCEPALGISGNWWCVDHIAERLLKQRCVIDNVLCVLQAALRLGHLQGLLWEGCEPRLVETHEWAATLQLVLYGEPNGGDEFVGITRDGIDEPSRLLDLWLPDCDNLWPVCPPVQTLAPLVESSKLETVVTAPTPTPTTTTQKQRRANLRHPDWPKIFKRWDPVVKTRGRWLNAYAAATEILKKQLALTISHSALYKGILDFIPEWWGLESKE